MDKRSAFTLFEVLLAIGILVTSVSVIAHLQMRALLRITSDHDEIEKTFLIKKELVMCCMDPQREIKKSVQKLEAPEVTLTTQVDEIPKKSQLAPLHDQVKVVRIMGEWKSERAKRSATMVAVVLKSEVEKEKEQKK